MILDNRVRSCRNYVRFQLHIKNISNNSGDLSKKCTALGVMSPQLGKCLCRGQRMTQGVTEGAPVLGESWFRWFLRSLSTSKFFSSVTCSGTEDDLNNLIPTRAQSTYYPKDWWAAVFNFHCWQIKRKWPLVVAVEMSGQETWTLRVWRRRIIAGDV